MLDRRLATRRRRRGRSRRCLRLTRHGRRGTAPAGEDKVTRVIVEAEPGSLRPSASAATDLGGQVVSRQQTLSTVVVDMPDRKVSRLREAAGVRRVTNDSQVKLQDTGLLGRHDTPATCSARPASPAT